MPGAGAEPVAPAHAPRVPRMARHRRLSRVPAPPEGRRSLGGHRVPRPDRARARRREGVDAGMRAGGGEPHHRRVAARRGTRRGLGTRPALRAVRGGRRRAACRHRGGLGPGHAPPDPRRPVAGRPRRHVAARPEDAGQPELLWVRWRRRQRLHRRRPRRVQERAPLRLRVQRRGRGRGRRRLARAPGHVRGARRAAARGRGDTGPPRPPRRQRIPDRGPGRVQEHRRVLPRRRRRRVDQRGRRDPRRRRHGREDVPGVGARDGVGRRGREGRRAGMGRRRARVEGRGRRAAGHEGLREGGWRWQRRGRVRVRHSGRRSGGRRQVFCGGDGSERRCMDASARAVRVRRVRLLSRGRVYLGVY